MCPYPPIRIYPQSIPLSNMSSRLAQFRFVVFDWLKHLLYFRPDVLKILSGMKFNDNELGKLNTSRIGLNFKSLGMCLLAPICSQTKYTHMQVRALQKFFDQPIKIHFFLPFIDTPGKTGLDHLVLLSGIG